MRVRARCLMVLLTSAAVGFACAGVPGTHPSYRVESLRDMGPLLEVKLEWTSQFAAGSSDRRFSLLFENAGCAKSLAVGDVVEYESGGQTGGVRIGDQSCHADGISDLRQWRDRKPRRYVTRHGDDRAQATYRVVYEQDDFAIVRGRFPLASLVAWFGGDDTLAILTKTEACSAALGKQVATMEFRDSGPVPLSIVGKKRCPIEGFARVVAELRES